jgi:hypothetical protein
MRNIFTGCAAVAALLCVGLACGAIKDGKPAAESGVIEFHSRLNEEKYDEIWDTSHQQLKDVSSREDLVKLLTAVRTKLGRVVDSKAQSWNVGNYNLTTTVTLTQATEFENGKADEKFVFVIENKRAFLQTYFINSMDLITK